MTKSPKDPTPAEKPVLRFLRDGQAYLTDLDAFGKNLDTTFVYRGPVTQYVQFVPLTFPEH